MSEQSSSFVHLHLHSQYSLLQGAIHLENLFDRVKSLGMDAVALTDTHNLFGAVDFYSAAKKAGIKPILGCELLYNPTTPSASTVSAPGTVQFPKHHHLVVLCKDLEGYRNLCRLLTKSYTDAFAFQGAAPAKKGSAAPRAAVTRELLDRYGDGLIVLSGCMRGEIPYRILSQEEDVALETALWFKKRFKGDFYFELQDAGIPEQAQLNQILSSWGEKHGIPCVVTSDCHYLESGDAESHEVLQCIEHGKNLDFERPKSLVPSEFHLKAPAEMAERFSRYPGALAETRKIADKCNVEFKFTDEQGRSIYHLPKFRPEGARAEDAFDLIAFFREQAKAGLEKRFTEMRFQSYSAERKAAGTGALELKKEYRARLDGELTMIEKTGFAGYFLIVADFIGWAKKNEIPVGPGRGSGAGSLVAWSLGITDIDPIQFNLLFERFINPERISMPDFDVDFCQDRRHEVIRYVEQKYGKENVCQIITFGKLQARAVIKDVARVLGLSFADSDAITKLLPEELDITIDRALAHEPRLKEKVAAEPRVAKVMEYAKALEGLYRNAGIHAAGVIITENPIVSYCALYMGKDGDLVTQLDKDFCEKIGLVKFDFLGLKTLTVIDNAVKLLRAGAETDADRAFSLETMSYTDPAAFTLISSGDTDGVFQVESSGMKDLCQRIQPSSLEDLTAINALYRPGPLGSGMVDDFIERKHGRKTVEYDVPQMATILKDTYGVILYQEQVMQTARELAGYSLGQADLLRRAMGKKKPEEMAKHREIFVKGAVGKGLEAKKAEAIFDLMAKFAEYGFNKSHSAAYGVLTYQTAYLKAHYPAEFMAALMTTEMDNTDKITKYIGDARRRGLDVLSPDVNRSQRRFSVEKDEKSRRSIRFGLEGIKGVGGIAVDAIIEQRETKAFESVLDFVRRVPTRKVNKKVLESLTLAGAFDTIAEVNRASLFASLEALLEHGGDEQEEKELGQSSLFDSFSSSEIKMVQPPTAIFKQEEDWPQSRKLALEKQVVGFYVSGHPLDAWQEICEEWLGWTTERVKTYVAERAASKKAAPAPAEMGFGGGFGPGRFRAPKTEVRLAGLIGGLREVMTKKGSRMAFGEIEDLKGKLEVVFFPEAYAKLQEFLKGAADEAEPVLLTGDVEIGEASGAVGDGSIKILARELVWVAEAHRERVQGVILKLKPAEVSPDQLRELKKNLLAFRGKCPVRIEFTDPAFRARMELPGNIGVNVTPQFVQSINRIFGTSVVQLR